MSAENVGTATGLANVAQGQLQDTRGTHDGVTRRVLGLTHTPNNGARVVLVQHLGDQGDLFWRHAADFFDFVEGPLGHDFFFDLVHTEHAVVEVFLVFPAIFEDDVQQAKDKGDV